MKKEDVKTVYCYDEKKNVVHYSKAAKGNVYFCIDCGAELICKHGEVYQKHLAHKNTDNCGGTGESIVHKHWKKNLFVPGMTINISNQYRMDDDVEVLEVLNGVSLSKRYNVTWDRDIKGDIILVTERGEILVEVKYKSKSKLEELSSYYNTLPLLKMFEVTVPRSVNSKFNWYSLDQYNKDQEELRTKREKELEKERLRLKKQEMMRKHRDDKLNQDEDKLFYSQHLKECLDFGLLKEIEVDVMFNFKNKLLKQDGSNYRLIGMYKVNGKYQKIKLNFDTELINMNEEKLLGQFEVEKGIRYVKVSLIETVYKGYNQVLKIKDVDAFRESDRHLYALLCNVEQ